MTLNIKTSDIGKFVTAVSQMHESHRLAVVAVAFFLPYARGFSSSYSSVDQMDAEKEKRKIG